MNQKDLPLWLQGENVVFYDNDQFAVIMIDNEYFPIGRFTGHLSTSGFVHLKDAQKLSQFYYKG